MSEIPTSWASKMIPSSLALAHTVEAKVKEELNKGIEVHPDFCNIYKALELVSPDKVKAVILGQDPYINRGEAMGLSFSVPAGCKLPPSLRNIFKELHDDLGCELPTSGDLTTWAEHGVLLLNTTLTVRHKESNSHSALGWSGVTVEVLNVCLEQPNPIAFLLWGRHTRRAIQTCSVYPGKKKLFLYSSHPSPLGAYSATSEAPAFIGSKPFSKTNKWLKDRGVEPIDWSLGA